MAEDIRTTGPVGLKGLKGVNQLPSSEEIEQERRAVLTGSTGPSIIDTSLQPYEGAMEHWGESRYDEPIINSPMSEGELQDTRYENQGWYDTLANGIGKMLGTAGTTFVSSLVGLPYGLFEAANQGRWSALWDNEVTQGLSKVDEWLEENLTNYRSQIQQNSPWYSPDNLFSMNFIADDIIKNAGFTLGAAASMAVGSGSLGLMSKALGFTNEIGKGTKIGMAALSSLFSATGEGMIEAKQGVEERNKLEMQRLEDSLAPEYNAIQLMQQEADQRYQMTGDYNTYKQDIMNIQAAKQSVDAKKAAGQQQIIESGQEMGNTILLANQALLTAGNFIQFGKGMVKSFDSARHAAEVTAKTAKPLGVRATKAGADLVGTGYKIAGKNLGKAMALTRGLLTEGSEEMNQQWIQSGAGAYYNREDINDYWKAKMDPEATKDTTEGLYTFGKALDRGFQESWGDVDQWEQFVIGGLTGMAGSYSPTKLFNQDKTKGRLDPRRYGSWEGGMYNELKDFNEKYSQFEENVNEVNRILKSEDFPERVRDMVGHTYTESAKTEAAEADDKKAFKDAEDKQFVHDVQSFLRAGKLDDLRAIYKSMSENLSDEDVESIIKNTTKEVSAEEDKQNHDRMMDAKIAATTDDEEKARLIAEKETYSGKPYSIGAYKDMDGNTMSYDKIRETVKHNAEELNRKLDSYLDSINVVNKMSKGKLSKDQEDNLAYLHNLSQESTVRFEKIMDDVRKKIPSKLLLKTEKSPEQLQQQFASSDLSFRKDDNTKKGYVEVDTSLMNDKAFGVFFVDNILRGNNIEAKDDKQAEKDAKEQLKTNEGLIRQAFVTNAMQNNGKSLAEALSSEDLKDLYDNINDANSLYSQAAQFYDTYLEYMLNPQKVDQDKAKEEKKQEDKNKKEKLDGASLDDMLNMSDDALAAILNDSKKGKNNAGNKARKALGMKNGRSKVKKELDNAVKSGALDEETAEDALKLFDEQLRRMQQEDDEAALQSMDAVVNKMFDVETDAMNDSEALISDEELEEGFDEEAYDERVSKAKDAIAAITDSIAKQLREMEDAIDKDVLNKALDDDDSPSEKAEKAARRAADNETKKQNPDPVQRSKRRGEEPQQMKPVQNILPTRKEMEEKFPTSEGEEKAIITDKAQGESGKNIPQTETKNNWHPWMSSTSEVGQYTNAPYEPSASDPNAAFKKKRYDVIRKKLVDTGAYERRRNGKIAPEMKVGFKVFQDVNDESGDFVIFITDEHGIILGDLPSNDPRTESSKRDVSMDDLYERVKQEWEDADDDTRKEGMQSGLYTKVDHVLVGKVLYQNERQTVKQLTEGKTEPLFAIKGNGGILITGEGREGRPRVSGILSPRTGNTGQPYVLIQTPNFHNNQNTEFKYYAVPIMTKTIEELDEASDFRNLLIQLLDKIKRGSIKDIEAKKLLQSLIAVGNVHINFEEDSNTKKKPGIRVTTFNRALGSEKGMPYTIFEGEREDMDINAVMQALGRFSVNVSADFINGNDGKDLRHLLTLDGKPLSDVQYNTMIAEVSDTNAASPETVNDWFTVRPLQKVGDSFVMAEPDKNMPTWGETESYEKQLVTVEQRGNKKDWEVRPSEGYKVYDENGSEILLFTKDETHTKAEQAEAARIAAEVYGKFTLKNSEEPFAVVLEGKTRIYDPKSRSFRTPKSLDKEGYDYKEIQKIKGDKSLSEDDKNKIINGLLTRRQSLVLWNDEEEAAQKGDKKTEEVDHSQEVLAKIAEMREDATHYKLVRWDEEQKKYIEDPNGDYYRDDRNGNIHARVSNVNEADEDIIEANKEAGFGKSNPQLKTVSTGAGNVVDRFIREYFRNGDLLEGLDLNKELDLKEAESRAQEWLKNNPFPNINNAEAGMLIRFLHEFKQKMGPDWIIDSTGLVASGVVSFDGKTSVNVAGTIDLMAYNPKKGQYVIIDMKSFFSPIFDKNGKIKTDVKTKAKIEHWRGQQTLYRNFLEGKFKIKIGVYKDGKMTDGGLRIMPIRVNYNTNFKNTDYTFENGVLKDKGIVVDISPYYGAKLISLEPKANVKYKTAQLPESVKRLMSNNPVSKPARDKKVKVKSELITFRDLLPEGSTLKDFISKDYQDNQDVLKLADILMKNKGSNKTVMMTAASQKLLMEALDYDAFDKAVQEAEARKQQIDLDIPVGTEMTMKEAVGLLQQYGIHSREIEELKQLPEDLFIKMAKDRKASLEALDILIEDDSIEDVEKYLRSLPSDATRHKKAKEGNYKKLDLQQEMRWLNRNLPQISKERRLQIIKGLIACSDGTMDFGRVEHGIMTIGTHAEEGTVYHEAFHYVVQFLLNDEEANGLFKAALERYGDMPLVALEERLADDFADYTKGIDPEESKLRRFFRELWNAIKAMFNNTSYIEQLFQDINTGVYAGTEFRNDRNNVFQSINDEQRQAAKNYEYLTDAERERLSEADVSKETFNSMTKDQQEYMLHCVV